MKTFTSVVALTFSLATCFSVAAFAENGGGGRASQNLPVGTALPNNGHAICTAAVNSDGTLAGRNLANPATSSRIGAGQYQIGFQAACADVRAVRGFMRIVTPDTLTTGSTGPRFCTAADRAGVTSAIFVQCFNDAGVSTDTSFTIMAVR